MIVFSGKALCVLDAIVGTFYWHYVASVPRLARMAIPVTILEGGLSFALPFLRLPMHIALSRWEKKYSLTLGRMKLHQEILFLIQA